MKLTYFNQDQALAYLAERPERAERLYLYAADRLKDCGVEVKLGIFGADMKIEQFNDGPVTILLESEADA